MSEIAIHMMIWPVIIGFLVFAVIGAGNPTIDDGIEKMSEPYPVIYSNSSLPNWCLNFVIDFWCFEPADIPGWVTLFPQYANVTMVRLEGLQETTAELTAPQNFTVVGQTVNVADITYIWGFLSLIFALGAVLQLVELVRP